MIYYCPKCGRVWDKVRQDTRYYSHLPLEQTEKLCAACTPPKPPKMASSYKYYKNKKAQSIYGRSAK